MKISNLLPIVAGPLADGSRILARFNLDVAEGIAARLVLVTSGRDGADMIWSARGPDGPSVKFSPEARDRVAAMARAELSALAAALRAA